MIDCGTFQVGLTVMYFIVSLSSGVACVGLPTTTRVIQTCWLLLITRRWKSGMFMCTWVRPNSRGTQRQRSRFASTVSIWRERFIGLSASRVAALNWPLTCRPRAFWNFATASASVRL